MLEVHALDCFYGRAQILFDLSLKVAAGEALALLGRNGAGKSTTLRAILGLAPLSRGRIVLDGRDISGMATGRIVRRGLGWVPEDRRIFTDLSVEGTVELERLTNVLHVGKPVQGQEESAAGLFRVLEGGREAVRTPVKLGRSSVSTIEIRDGLQPGDRIILSDMSQWDAHDRVRLK